MITKRIALLVTIPLLAAAASPWAAAALFSSESPAGPSYESTADCPFEFQKFHQSVVWSEGGTRLLLEASRACGAKQGHRYDLENVTLTLFSGEKVVSRMHSPTGVYALMTNNILLARAVEEKDHRCLGNPEVMNIELKTSEVRMPGHRFFLNDRSTLPCFRRSTTS